MHKGWNFGAVAEAEMQIRNTRTWLVVDDVVDTRQTLESGNFLFTQAGAELKGGPLASRPGKSQCADPAGPLMRLLALLGASLHKIVHRAGRIARSASVRSQAAFRLRKLMWGQGSSD